MVPSKFRGRVHVDLDKCISCGCCERSCPTGAIKLKKVKGHKEKKAVCDHSICIHCGECEYVCPVSAIELKSEQEVIDG